MKIGVAGDWHGNAQWATHMLKLFKQTGVSIIHQVGDFGIGWPEGMLVDIGNGRTQFVSQGEAFAQHIDNVCQLLDLTLYITPGNHENWDFINALPFQNGQAWIGERICVLERGVRFEMGGRQFLSLSGAPSIDYDRRTEGRSWWRAEALTLSEAEQAAAGGHADVMLTHDAPDNCTDKVDKICGTSNPYFSEAGHAYAEEGRKIMNIAVEGVKPKVFIHGHFHTADDKVVGDTHFISLHQDGESKNGIILDLDDLSFEWVGPAAAKARKAKAKAAAKQA